MLVASSRDVHVDGDQSGPHAPVAVLVVEDDPITAKLIRGALEAEGLSVVAAADGAQAIGAFGERTFALVLIDLLLADVDGFELLRRFRALPGAAETPVVALTGFLSHEVEARVSVAGFDDVIRKPIEPSRLVQIVRGHLPPAPTNAPPARPAGAKRRVVLADDDAVQRKLVALRLTRAGYEVDAAVDGQEALERAKAIRPDAIVSDVLMPRLDGFGLCMAVRGDADLASTPVVLITNSYLETSDRELARRTGASDLIVRTPDLAEVLAALDASIGSLALAPVADVMDPELERERARRVMSQLERQVALNAGAAQRNALLTAELSVLSAISQAVATNRDIEGALRQVLAACFDAGGISVGALYLVDGTGLRVWSFGALDAWEPGTLEGFFGDRALLDASIRGQTLIVAPAPRSGARERAILARAGVQALVAAPLGSIDQPLGALVMLSHNTELGSADRIAFARAVAAQVSLALMLARAFADKDASERAAQSQATVLRSILENMADGVVVASETGEITHRNRAADTIPPITPGPDESLAAPDVYGPDKVTPVPSDELPLVRAMRGESVDGAELFVRRDGTDGAWFSVNARPMRDELGAPRGGVAVFRDITSEKLANAQLLVSDRLASLGTLAAGVGHEINSPLASALANLELASNDVADLVREHPEVNFGELADEIHDAREGAERLRHIVRDLKLFSRADEDTRGKVELDRVLDSSIRMVTSEIRHRAKLVRNYGRIPPVHANESRLGQVFVNLLVNAAHAIPEGRANLNEICVATSVTPDDRVRISISDTGTGMSPEIAARIFTPFFTTKPVGVGTGLGLAICHQLVTAIGGDITVDTALGRGTTFSITLPAMTGPLAVGSSPMPRLATPTRRARVLVIDDDELIITTVQRGLGSDHDVTALTDPGEATRRIASGERFDVILCDLMMPTGTGMDLYESLTHVAPDQAQNIVFITGGAFTPTARVFLDEVPNPSIEKPFSLENLRAMINDRIVAH
jgi:CheY-like chemotaxis protein